MWRSLVAHLLWEQGVAGSNPAIPTIQVQKQNVRAAGYEPIDTVYEADFEYPVVVVDSVYRPTMELFIEIRTHRLFGETVFSKD